MVIQQLIIKTQTKILILINVYLNVHLYEVLTMIQACEDRLKIMIDLDRSMLIQ